MKIRWPSRAYFQILLILVGFWVVVRLAFTTLSVLTSDDPMRTLRKAPEVWAVEAGEVGVIVAGCFAIRWLWYLTIRATPPTTTVIQGLRIFSTVWLWGVVAFVVGGDIAFVVFAASKWAAIWQIAEDMEPYNVQAWLLKFILAAPRIAAFVLSEELRRREAGSR